MVASNTVGRLRDIVEKAEDAIQQKKEILDLLGDVAQEVLHDQVLVATFAGSKYHPGTTLLRTDRDLKEQQFQGSVALVVGMGPDAFKWNGNFSYEGPKPEIGDWVLVRPADGLNLNIKQFPCRLFHPENIRMIVRDPMLYW